MNSKAIRELAINLKEGILLPCDPRDLEAAVRSIADELARSETSVEQVRKAVKVLNNVRHFEHTRTLGKAWLECRPFDATIAKCYAQALIDLFELDTAEALLNDALKKAEARSADAQAQGEIPEYRGLLGRVEKQRYVMSGDRQRLVEATNRYLAQIEAKRQTDDWFWHAINAIALAACEQREGIIPHDRKTPIPSTSDVYKHMKKLYQKTPDDPWVLATASEAALARGRCDDAELWLYRFLNHERVQPFYVQSYDRQLREIWQGDPTRGGNNCADRLARITARHILRTQSQYLISSAAVSSLKQAIERGDLGDLEKNFLGESTFSVANIRDMLAACSSIGCVTNKLGARLGTGFLVDGAWLGFGHAGTVFVTNAHVLSATVPKAISPDNALVTFEVASEIAQRPIFYRVDQVLFESEPGNLGASSDDTLDVTVVTLKSETQVVPHFTPLKIAPSLPLVQYKSRAYVVGHPMGSGLQISLNDSLLLDIDGAERLVHYRTPTDPGSSGSPVFNTDWEVIGLHHGGSRVTPRLKGTGNYEANEAISLLAIRRKISDAFSSGTIRL
jgi:V8-like Glu-specific endopeptidase